MEETKLTDSLRDAITLAEAAKDFPTRPPVQQVHRWSTHGVRGVKLMTWLCGGKRVTTAAAVETFLRELNAERPATPTDDAQEKHRAEQAGAALDALLATPPKTLRKRREKRTGTG